MLPQFTHSNRYTSPLIVLWVKGRHSNMLFWNDTLSELHFSFLNKVPIFASHLIYYVTPKVLLMCPYHVRAWLLGMDHGLVCPCWKEYTWCFLKSRSNPFIGVYNIDLLFLQAARPLVSVYNEKGERTTDNVKLPAVFKASIRPDIVSFVHSEMKKNGRQPYAVSVKAGK